MKFFRVFVLGSCLLNFFSCALIWRTREVMPVIWHSAKDHTNSCLVVFLPGFSDQPEDFVKQGFVKDVQERTGCDVAAVDAHYGYYREMSVVDRLRTDVFKIAEERGYQTIWVAGPSMGGLGSILATRAFSDQVDGAILMAPYLGTPSTIDEIRLAGSLRDWLPTNPEDFNQGLWVWLKEESQKPEPRLYLGYGKQDRLAPDNALLAGALASDHVFVTEGGHDWPPWKKIFEHFLPKILASVTTNSKR